MHSPHGIDAGDHEWEYDPVADQRSDEIADYLHGEDFQGFLREVIDGCEEHMANIGDDVPEIACLLSAARAVYVYPRRKTLDELVAEQRDKKTLDA